MSVTIFWNVIFFLLVCAWIQVFTGQDTKEDEMYVTWWTRTLWCGLTTVCVQLNAVPRGFLTCKIRTCKANRLQMSDVLLSSLCFLYGDVGQHRHSVVEKHRKGMSRLYFLRKLRSFSVCAKMMRAGTLHPVVERTWPWQCCSMTDTGHTGHTGQAAELLFKQTGSVLLPQTQRQETFTPHAATFYNPIYLPQSSACDLLPPTTQSKSHRGDSNRYSPL